MGLDKRSEELLHDLNMLHKKLRSKTYEDYKRINPFLEDMFDWKERATFWLNGDKNVTIYNSTTLNGNVEIGNDTWIGPFCSLDGGDVGLTIGSFCSISASCHLVTHDSVKWALSKGRHSYEYAPTSIGDGCFIGTGSIITRGVHLGDQCLVAAGSVVTKSFDSFSIVGGVPAKKIGHVVIDDEGNPDLVFDR